MKNLACSLIEHKRINTTLAKAKALRIFIEPLVTKSKNNNTHSRRVVFSYLQNKYAVDTLFTEIREKIGDRPGGYLRIIKLNDTRHDNADMAMIEFVDYNTLYNPNTSLDGKAKTKTRRSRRKGGSATKASATTEVVEEVKEEVTEDAPAVEEVVENVAEEVKQEVEDTASDSVEDTAAESPSEGDDDKKDA